MAILPINLHSLDQDTIFHLAHECLRRLPPDLQAAAIKKAIPDPAVRDRLAQAVEA